MLESIHFLHRQGIHVGAQADGACRGAMLDDADHASAAQAAYHGNAPLRQFGGDHVRGALFFVAQLGVRVQVAADTLQLGLKRQDRIN